MYICTTCTLAGDYLFELVVVSFVCSSRDKLPPLYYSLSSHLGTF